jgi:hypothetical protein
MALAPAPVDPMRQYFAQLLNTLQTRYADDRRTAHVMTSWDGSAQASVKRGTVTIIDRRLVVGPWCPRRDSLGLYLTRLIVAIAKASVRDSLCAGTTAWLLQIATNELGWPCEVTCDTCYKTGVCAQAECPKCTWNLEDCAKTNKFVWPELVGRPAWLASLILKHFHPTKRVVLDPWDMLYQTPADPDVIRIVYDARSGLVVTPAPHVTSSPEISGPREACYLAPGGLCLGAPPNPPPKEWQALVGEQLGGTIQWLRLQYPHAVIMPTPANAVVSRDWRHDRIRVRYNPQTMLVSHVPTVG